MARDSNEPRYAPYPQEVKSATMVQRYDKLTYEEQSISDLQRDVRSLGPTHIKIIDKYLELGGTISNGEYDDGTVNPSEYWFTFGSTTLWIHFNKDLVVDKFMHYGMPLVTPKTKYMEIDEICMLITAVGYRDAPDKAAYELALAKVNLRNSQMVNGIQDISDRLKADTLLLSQALSGANIEHIMQTDIYKAQRAKEDDSEDK